MLHLPLGARSGLPVGADELNGASCGGAVPRGCRAASVVVVLAEGGGAAVGWLLRVEVGGC